MDRLIESYHEGMRVYVEATLAAALVCNARCRDDQWEVESGRWKPKSQNQGLPAHLRK